MTTWQRSAPSNQITPTHQRNSRVEDSPSDPPELLVEEILEFQEEYPREVAEEVEEEEEAVEEVSLLLYHNNQQLPMEETNLLATRHLYSQETAPNQKRS